MRYLEFMFKERVTVVVSVAQFAQLVFIGFGGSFVTELIKEDPNPSVLFWSSMFSLVLGVFIGYLYAEAFALTRNAEKSE